MNSVHRGSFPTRWTPSPNRILPPRDLLDLLDRIYARSGKRSGAFDVLAWSGEGVLFAEAKHGGKDALRPSQKAWIEAALDEGVPLGSLLVVEWGFGSDVERTIEGVASARVASGPQVPGTPSTFPSQRDGMSAAPPVEGTRSDDQPLGASVTINNYKPIISTRRVKLNLRADDLSLRSGVVEMRIKNGGGEPWTEWRQYAPRVDWKLSEGVGQKVVYMQFRDSAGTKSELAKATITLRPRIGGGFGLGSGESRIPTSRRASESRASDPEETSHLDSEDVDSQSPEDPEIFLDAYDTEAHSKFLRWRERNSRGHVISRRSATEAMIHRASCGHFEHGDKSASMTRTMKVCSQNKEELEAWRRENIGDRLKRCRSCMQCLTRLRKLPCR